MTRNSDDSPYPNWPPSPLLDATFREMRQLMQTCTDLLAYCTHNLDTIERRLHGLQLAYNAAADYTLERALTVALTARERQVLALAARGLTNQEIGAELGIGRGTVRNHMTSILGKLSARNRREAVGLARMFGLL